MISLVLGLSSSAFAYPHVWISTITTFLFQEKKLTSVRFHWTFDDVFSSIMIGDYDKNRNKRLEKDEVEAIQKQTFPFLKKFNFFSHILLDGKKRKIEDVKNFKAEISDGRLIYQFEIPFESPVNNASSDIKVSVFDESYYVDVFMAKEKPVRFQGRTCSFEMTKDKSAVFYFGMISPDQISLKC